MNVAIDGPAGAGKSTIARAAAKKLGFIYVDTGALYRAVGVYSLRNGLDTENPETVEGTLPHIQVELQFQDGVQHVLLNGEDVSEEIRTPQASMAASAVSAVPAVRRFLFDLQREIAAKNDCIMDVRDPAAVDLHVRERRVGAAGGARVPVGNAARSGAEAQRHYGRARHRHGGFAAGRGENLFDCVPRNARYAAV